MITEADTCRKYVLPKLYSAGWSDDQISEQKIFTDGRIILAGDKGIRKKQKRADYLLKYRRDFSIAVVEAKSAYKNAADGLQQAKEYAEILGLKFAYSTNGKGIVEHDFITGKDTDLESFPAPDELWMRLSQSEDITPKIAQTLLAPCSTLPGKTPRYYQEITINRTIKAVLQGKKRILLTLATGTGKTYIAFQIIWKLWDTRWNRTGEHRRPKVLYLADRNILVDDPKDKTFASMGDARIKIEGEAIKSREIYFSTYQAIAKDERRPGLYKQYTRDFFDLIVVDECHRGSAKDESNWREILEYFEPAYQIGMTATPLRKDNRDTYRYFGNPIYTYSLKQGIEDGFLAPYRVHRIVPSVDATGWRPTKGEKDKHGREIPDGVYGTGDFERVISFKSRTDAVAKHLTDYLMKTDRLAKTIVFCVDQEHAEDMRKALNNWNSDLVQQYPDYVCRVVSDEGDIGRGHLDRFLELETRTPVILTTSQLLTTGVDAQTCKNIVLFKVINSMVDFKQIIGRGTRVREDYGKLFFTILDYTGSATRLFADPEFDGEPALITEEEIDDEGNSIKEKFKNETKEFIDEVEAPLRQTPKTSDYFEGAPKKYYVNGGSVEIIADVVYELDSDGRRLSVIKYTDYTAKQLKSMYTGAAELRSKWSDAEQRRQIISLLEERGITIEQLVNATKKYDADPFDLLCHIAYNAPLRTRRERAERLRKDRKDFFERFGEKAREILNEVLDKYIEFGTEQLADTNILKVPPISLHGNLIEISALFGGPAALRNSLGELQSLLYSDQEG
ncbi:helicase, type I site-specific restriction-modification system restriction subunit [Candidatus Methanoperedens nitroreducens]|uniref:Helicase, type I site-specific restriction-modification system restriction subunit n=1 Tax=Candidatus Methanoperedens nitratireducens TaxID=1392998 RepID=A0A062V2N9_9EURY|nr:DEAD/DEAH box helicase family protein [Candidatus Methanoperedens nitroreducens]KCZ71637.1 helicase, type I site-specific restriction-modification system restriction subunit [Candidatus Methanoperedens nitroreducens]MDJ1421265.1 DEAD/DEAH box helicase family protein [Candidatus Methanoperedens sp.]